MAFTTCTTNCLIRGLRVAAFALLPWTTAHGADVAFMQVGENGELSFSDIASPNATEIPLATFDTPTISTDEQIVQMLKVAQELAQARQQREMQRAAAKAARSERLEQEEEQYSSSSSTLRRDVYVHPGYHRNWSNQQYRQPRKKPVEETHGHANTRRQLHSPLKVQR